jgi:hypothetical protein
MRTPLKYQEPGYDYCHQDPIGCNDLNGRSGGYSYGPEGLLAINTTKSDTMTIGFNARGPNFREGYIFTVLVVISGAGVTSLTYITDFHNGKGRTKANSTDSTDPIGSSPGLWGFLMRESNSNLSPSSTITTPAIFIGASGFESSWRT